MPLKDGQCPHSADIGQTVTFPYLSVIAAAASGRSILDRHWDRSDAGILSALVALVVTFPISFPERPPVAFLADIGTAAPAAVSISGAVSCSCSAAAATAVSVSASISISGNSA